MVLLGYFSAHSATVAALACGWLGMDLLLLRRKFIGASSRRER